MFCHEQVAQLRDAGNEIESRGVKLAVVGNGQPFQARAFRDEWDIDFPLLVDPDLRAYAAAGMRRGMLAMIDRHTPQHIWRAWSGGHRQGSVKGDPWQSGGVFLIEPPGLTRYRHVSKVPGDHAPIGEVLAAVQGFRAAS